VSIVDQQQQGSGPGLADVAIGWLALWDEAADIFDGLPDGHRALIVKAGQGLDVLPAAFATLDPELRAAVTVVLRQIVDALTGDCGVSRLPERCPPGCAHRSPAR
jgi:hypothetical protein